MNFKIYNFQKIDKQLQHESPGEYYNSADYFQWYTTGIESVVQENESSFFLTKRLNNERPEVLSWKFFGDANYADLLTSVNNDNFLWDGPTDWDTAQFVIQNKMNYLKRVNKVQFDPDEENYWNEKMTSKVSRTIEVQSTVIVPKYPELQSIVRKIKRYLESRVVK
jgi:elongation factor P--beta-lysine ligase